MDATAYDRIVRNLCIAVGIDDWRTAAEARHIEVDGCTVGLQHADEDACSETLSVYVELGQTPDVPSAIRQRLLQANVHRDRGTRGYFGEHEDTGCIVYCFHVDACGAMESEALADLLLAQVRASANLLRALECLCP